MVKFNVGDFAPETNYYRIVDLNGKTISSAFIIKGQRFPPYNQTQCYYVLDT